MFASYSLTVLAVLFFVAACAIWFAGIELSNTTDVLSHRFGFGEAIGGVILLAVATNLPEIAIVATAAWSGSMDIAVGNILGGVAIQTVVLVVLDVLGMAERVPLTYKAASLTLVIEGLIVVAVLIISIMGTQLPDTLVVARIAPDALLITVVWMIGIWLITRANKGLPWHNDTGKPAGAQDQPKGHSRGLKEAAATERKVSTTRSVLGFVGAAAVTLIAGVILEQSGSGIASQIGMSGVLFGATVLAAATSLPEVSTGLASTKLGDYQLAVSDIFGGNAFLPVLFLLATIISGKAVLPNAHPTDIYLAGLAILLTSIYLGGLIFRPKRNIMGMGVDSLAVLILYAVGIVGLLVVAAGSKTG